MGPVETSELKVRFRCASAESCRSAFGRQRKLCPAVSSTSHERGQLESTTGFPGCWSTQLRKLHLREDDATPLDPRPRPYSGRQDAGRRAPKHARPRSARSAMGIQTVLAGRTSQHGRERQRGDGGGHWTGCSGNEHDAVVATPMTWTVTAGSTAARLSSAARINGGRW